MEQARRGDPSRGEAGPMKVAYLGPAGTFSEEALRIAAARRDVRARPCGDHPRRRSRRSRAARPSSPSSRSRTRSRGRCAPRSTRSPSTPSGSRIVGEYDHEVRQTLIARPDLPLERDRGVLSHPQATRAVRRASCAMSSPARRSRRSARPPRRCGASPSPAGRGRRSARRRRGRGLRLRRAARGRRGRGGQRHPLRLARSPRRRAAGRGPRRERGGPRSSSSSSGTTGPAL